MPSVLDAPTAVALPHSDTATAGRYAELGAARQRWLTDGGSPESVAAYAHALRALIGDV